MREHESLIEDFVPISPNAAVVGNIPIKKGAHIELGANIVQGLLLTRML